MDREKLLERIRRLLRLSESPNVHEAASAAARARELMARHRIESAALEPEGLDPGIRDYPDEPLDTSKRLRPWKMQLGDAIARANGCRVYVLERGSMLELVPVGREEDAALVRALYGELVKQVECLTRKHGAGRDRTFCNGFRLGVVSTLRERLERANVEAERGLLEGGVFDDEATVGGPDSALAPAAHALAVAKLSAREHAVDRYLEETLRLRKGKGRSLRADAEGYERGLLAGHSVALPDGSSRAPAPSGRRRA